MKDRFSIPKLKCQQTLTFRDANMNLTFGLTFKQLNIYVFSSLLCFLFFVCCFPSFVFAFVFLCCKRCFETSDFSENASSKTKQTDCYHCNITVLKTYSSSVLSLNDQKIIKNMIGCSIKVSVSPRLSLQPWVFRCARDPLVRMERIAGAPKHPRLETEPKFHQVLSNPPHKELLPESMIYF